MLIACAQVFLGPLCLLAFLGTVLDSPLRHAARIGASACHVYGCLLYFATAALGGGSHCRPERLYYWGYYVGMNVPWIVVPSGKSGGGADGGGRWLTRDSADLPVRRGNREGRARARGARGDIEEDEVCFVGDARGRALIGRQVPVMARRGGFGGFPGDRALGLGCVGFWTRSWSIQRRGSARLYPNQDLLDDGTVNVTSQCW